MSTHTDNLTHTFFVAGTYDSRKDKTQPRARNAPFVIVEYAKTVKGWRQRCRHGNEPALNNDYVSGETRARMDEWLMVDFMHRFQVFETEAECLAYRDRVAPCPEAAC